MPKIVIIGSYAPSLINFRGHLIKSLVKSKYDVVACAPAFDERTISELQFIGASYKEYSLHSTGLNILWDFISFCQILKILKIEKPNIIFLYTIKPVIYGSIAAKLADVKSIYSLISGLGSTFVVYDWKSRVLNNFIIIMYKISLTFNKKIFFQNSDDLNLFFNKKLIKKTEKAILVNGSGVDLKFYHYEGNYPSKISFLLISRMIREKGIYEFIEAAKILKKDWKNLHFDIVGFFDDNVNKINTELLSEMNDQGIINFHGSTTDVRPFIRNSSIYVLPSFYREGIPRSILEAMSMGRPIITTSLPGCKETVIQGENGFLVSPKSVSSLVEAMIFFIKNPEAIPRMGYKSRKIAEKKFNVHTVNQTILKEMNIRY